MTTGREDDAWRAIVDNYGERAELDDPPDLARTSADPADGGTPTTGDVVPAEWDDPEERFVPPVPPRGPRLPLPRRLAWFALLGSPAVLVVALLTTSYVPPFLGYALVAAFLGGFAFLVTTMQRAHQRDPWDDGAQL